MNSPNSLLLELSFNARGELVIHLPTTQTFKSGNRTLRRGYVEEDLRNILNIENKIRHHEAEFYGEPDTNTLARDLKVGRIIPRINPRPNNNILDLEL